MLEIIIQQATFRWLSMLASAFPAMPRRRWNGGRRGVSEYGDCRRGRSRQLAKAFRLAVEAGLLARQSGPAAAVILLMPPAR